MISCRELRARPQACLAISRVTSPSASLKTDKDLARESIKLEFQRAYAHLHRAKTHAEVLGMEDQVSALLNSLEEVMV
jgi:hypothetical protein